MTGKRCCIITTVICYFFLLTTFYFQNKKKRESSINEDDDEVTTMEEESTLYESVWEDIKPAPPTRTTSIRPGTRKRRYDISDFKFLKVLGKGTFGKVRTTLNKSFFVFFVFLCILWGEFSIFYFSRNQ